MTKGCVFMKIFLYGLGGLCILSAIGTLNPIVFILGCGLIYLAYKKSKANVNNVKVAVPNTENNSSQTAQASKNSIEFNIAGVTFKNKDGHSIQKLIKEYAIENAVNDPFEDLSNKEILEFYSDERIYEFSDVIGYDEIRFELEPDNPYDPNAILVVHEDIGEIGHVPKTHISKIKKIIDLPYSTQFQVVGGRYKEVVSDDDGKEKVKIITDSYGIAVTVTY